MKAIALTAKKNLESVTVPDVGLPKEDEVIIRVRAVGVCGSDMHYYRTGRIGSQVVTFPFILGHEFAGEIVSVGKYVEGFKAGDRVAVDPAMPCLQCDQCRTGREHTCRNLNFLGCPGQVDGCMKAFIAMPAHSCYLLPDSLSFNDGMLCEPFSIGVYSVKSYGDVRNKKAAVLGFGPIGMSVTFALRAYGVGAFVVTDKLDYRLEFAKISGASAVVNAQEVNLSEKILYEHPDQFDVVFECCGKQEAVMQAIELLKPGGTLMVIGIPEFDVWHLPVDDLRRKEITIKNVRRQNGCMQEAIDLLNGQSRELNAMITHQFNMEDAQKAYDIVESYKDGVMKAVISF